MPVSVYSEGHTNVIAVCGTKWIEGDQDPYSKLIFFKLASGKATDIEVNGSSTITAVGESDLDADEWEHLYRDAHCDTDSIDTTIEAMQRYAVGVTVEEF